MAEEGLRMVIFHKNLEVYRLILEFIKLAAEIIKLRVTWHLFPGQMGTGARSIRVFAPCG